jgi:hypothetical protein
MLHFIGSLVRCLKGSSRGGCTRRHWWSWCKGWLRPTSYSFIYSFINYSPLPGKLTLSDQSALKDMVIVDKLKLFVHSGIWTLLVAAHAHAATLVQHHHNLEYIFIFVVKCNILTFLLLLSAGCDVYTGFSLTSCNYLPLRGSLEEPKTAQSHSTFLALCVDNFPVPTQYTPGSSSSWQEGLAFSRWNIVNDKPGVHPKGHWGNKDISFSPFVKSTTGLQSKDSHILNLPAENWMVLLFPCFMAP